MTYAPAPSTQPMTRQRGITWRYVSAHPLPKRHHADPAIRLRTIFRHRGNFATHRFRLLSSSPQLGSGTFLPGGRPPVNVSRKGGQSPNSERVPQQTPTRGSTCELNDATETRAEPDAPILEASPWVFRVSRKWVGRTSMGNKERLKGILERQAATAERERLDEEAASAKAEQVRS